MGNERKQNVYERLIKFNRIPEGGREREREIPIRTKRDCYFKARNKSR